MQNPFGSYQTIDANTLPARSVAQLDPMTFLENLEIDAHGDIIMTSILDGRLWRVSFGKKPELITQLPGRAYSVAAAPDRGWLVFGPGDPPRNRRPGRHGGFRLALRR